jgi:hypothetical protein
VANQYATGIVGAVHAKSGGWDARRGGEEKDVSGGFGIKFRKELAFEIHTLWTCLLSAPD